MKNITGIILAGGKSSRMGKDKGILELKGKKIVEYIISALVPNVDEIIIIANNSNYNNLGFKVFQDIIKDCGPMSGIYTGLEKTSTEKNIIVGCDIPNVSSKAIEYIVSQSQNEDVLVPVHNKQIEPLCAVYKKSCSKQLKQILASGNYKMTDALQKLKTSYIDVSLLGDFAGDIFTNINTPSEFEKQKLK